MIVCSRCNQPYPEEQTPYRCISCGGVYDFVHPLEFALDETEVALPGIWRYRKTFSLPKIAPVVSLGEGNTPLIWNEVFGRKIAFKLEFLNPTGSFKDRGTAPLVSFLCARGVAVAVEDSSGNAGASFAAYAAFAGIDAKIFVPDFASGPKRTQIEAYGVEVVKVSGPRSNTAEAAKQAADMGAVYASHVYMPYCVLGYATIAYELWHQLGTFPGTVIVPAGQGGLLLGIGRGFEALQHAGMIDQKPVLVGVQAAACAPLWAASIGEAKTFDQILEVQTLAEGVSTRNPVREEVLLQLVQSTQGSFVAVSEEKILSGRDHLAHLGLFVEPTSAIVWDGLSQVVGQVPEPIVVVLTGSGLKSNQ